MPAGMGHSLAAMCLGVHAGKPLMWRWPFRLVPCRNGSLVGGERPCTRQAERAAARNGRASSPHVTDLASRASPYGVRVSPQLGYVLFRKAA